MKNRVHRKSRSSQVVFIARDEWPGFGDAVCGHCFLSLSRPPGAAHNNKESTMKKVISPCTRRFVFLKGALIFSLLASTSGQGWGMGRKGRQLDPADMSDAPASSAAQAVPQASQMPQSASDTRSDVLFTLFRNYPALLKFATDFLMRLGELNQGRISHSGRPSSPAATRITQGDRRLDALARLLEGDEVCAAVAYDCEEKVLRIATNQNGHTNDHTTPLWQRSYALFCHLSGIATASYGASRRPPFFRETRIEFAEEALLHKFLGEFKKKSMEVFNYLEAKKRLQNAYEKTWLVVKGMPEFKDESGSLKIRKLLVKHAGEHKGQAGLNELVQAVEAYDAAKKNLSSIEAFVKDIYVDFSAFEESCDGANDLISDWFVGLYERVKGAPKSWEKSKIDHIVVRFFTDLIKLENFASTNPRNPIIQSMVRRAFVIDDDGGDGVHAEMRHVAYAKLLSLKYSYVGISMLCCAYCHWVMDSLMKVKYFERSDDVETPTRGQHCGTYRWPFHEVLKDGEVLKLLLGDVLYKAYLDFGTKNILDNKVSRNLGDVALFVLENLPNLKSIKGTILEKKWGIVFPKEYPQDLEATQSDSMAVHVSVGRKKSFLIMPSRRTRLQYQGFDLSPSESFYTEENYRLSQSQHPDIELNKEAFTKEEYEKSVNFMKDNDQKLIEMARRVKGLKRFKSGAYIVPDDHPLFRVFQSQCKRDERLPYLLTPQGVMLLDEEVYLDSEQAEDLWYTDMHMSDLLNHYLAGDPFYISPPVTFEGKELFTKQIKHAIRHVKRSGGVAVLPLNLHGNHWVGVVFYAGKDEHGVHHINVIYSNPQGYAIDLEENAVLFVQTVQEVAVELELATPSIIDLRLRQQHNGDDCGPFTVDNLIQLARAAARGVLSNLTDSDAIIAVSELYQSHDGSADALRQRHRDNGPAGLNLPGQRVEAVAIEDILDFAPGSPGPAPAEEPAPPTPSAPIPSATSAATSAAASKPPVKKGGTLSPTPHESGHNVMVNGLNTYVPYGTILPSAGNFPHIPTGMQQVYISGEGNACLFNAISTALDPDRRFTLAGQDPREVRRWAGNKLLEALNAAEQNGGLALADPAGIPALLLADLQQYLEHANGYAATALLSELLHTLNPQADPLLYGTLASILEARDARRTELIHGLLANVQDLLSSPHLMAFLRAYIEQSIMRRTSEEGHAMLTLLSQVLGYQIVVYASNGAPGAEPLIVGANGLPVLYLYHTSYDGSAPGSPNHYNTLVAAPPPSSEPGPSTLTMMPSVQPSVFQGLFSAWK